MTVFQSLITPTSPKSKLAAMWKKKLLSLLSEVSQFSAFCEYLWCVLLSPSSPGPPEFPLRIPSSPLSLPIRSRPSNLGPVSLSVLSSIRSSPLHGHKFSPAPALISHSYIVLLGGAFLFFCSFECVCVCVIMFVRQDEDARACASCMRALSPQDSSQQ